MLLGHHRTADLGGASPGEAVTVSSARVTMRRESGVHWLFTGQGPSHRASSTTWELAPVPISIIKQKVLVTFYTTEFSWPSWRACGTKNNVLLPHECVGRSESHAATRLAESVCAIVFVSHTGRGPQPTQGPRLIRETCLMRQPTAATAQTAIRLGPTFCATNNQYWYGL